MARLGPTVAIFGRIWGETLALTFWAEKTSRGYLVTNRSRIGYPPPANDNWRQR